MRINKYLNFITEEAYNFEAGEKLKYSDEEWLPNEIKDLNDLGADEISKNTAIFKQGEFNITIQKKDKSPFYVATSDVPPNKEILPKNSKFDYKYKNYITNNLWGGFLKKLYRFVKSGDNSIELLLNKLKIKNWIINEDGTIDVDGDVRLQSEGLEKIPLNFGEVSGYFNCKWNGLTTLIGCPKRVGGNFNCNSNYNLTSLEGCPNYIGGEFACQFNKNLWSMDHFPRHAKGVWLEGTPINTVFNLFKTPYLADGGEFFSTSGTMMDYFQDCDPVYPDKIIKKMRMNNFLHSIGKELRLEDIAILKNEGWKIQD